MQARECIKNPKECASEGAKKAETSILNNFRGWREEIRSHNKVILISLILWVCAFILSRFSGGYAERRASVSVADLILDNIPTINLDLLYAYGFTLIVAVLLLYPLFFKIKKLHVVISQISLLMLIKSFFIILTHLKFPAGAVISSMPKIYGTLFFNNALFFSGHVAFTFLGFLLFRKEKRAIGLLFLASTFVMALTVLFMHIHYSIDVFAALFISYGSYKIGNYLFEGLESQ